MNIWKVILATVVIFVAGIITGGLLVNSSGGVAHRAHKALLAENSKKNQPAAATVSNSPREIRVPLPPNILLRKDFLERIDRELKLNATQHERIEKIISEGQERIKDYCKKIEPEVQLELAETREKISAELTPAQQCLFTELLKRRPTNPLHGTTNPPSPAAMTNSARAGTPQ